MKNKMISGDFLFSDNKKQLLELVGSVQHIIFRNEKNGYTVLEIISSNESVTAVGIMPLVNVGEDLRLIGVWKNHSSFGTQFSVETFERRLPSTSDTIFKYLSSGAIKGIGKQTAEKLVDSFGDKTLEIIENEPERLSEIKGMTKNRAKKISEEFKKIFGIKELMAYLEKFSITSEESIKIWQSFGSDSIEIIKRNPYVICNDPICIGFDKADFISNSMEVPQDDNGRICAGLLYVLNHNMKNGHTCLPMDKLVEATSKFLEVDVEKISSVLNNMKEDGSLSFDCISSKDFVYTNDMHMSEIYSAGRLVMMVNFPSTPIKEIEKEINLIEKEEKISYANLQKEAINKALTKGVLVLTGGPGTGKTTTLNAIIKILTKKGEKVFLTAPTGRAAQRMTQLTGSEAKTIHRLLEVEWSEDDRPVFRRNEKNLLKCDAIIVDELSMVDINLFESLLKSLPLGCRLIMVGDSDQLPSVGAGNVLSDLIKSNVLPVVQLKEIFRQSMKSLIVLNAHKIVKGEMPDIFTKDNDFFFLNKNDISQAESTILDLCARRLPNTYSYSPFFDIQVLCPSRKGLLGTVNLNSRLQERINPANKNKIEININGIIFREGDKVMQVKNNYDIQFTKDDGTLGNGIFNGDVGILKEINKSKSSMIVRFDDKEATYDLENAFNLELAYAITVHKSQGNEFEAVVIPVLGSAPQLCYRNLIYTAVTRAKSFLTLVGNTKTLERMVLNDRKTKRYSGLSEFMTRGIEN